MRVAASIASQADVCFTTRIGCYGEVLWLSYIRRMSHLDDDEYAYVESSSLSWTTCYICTLPCVGLAPPSPVLTLEAGPAPSSPVQILEGSLLPCPVPSLTFALLPRKQAIIDIRIVTPLGRVVYISHE